MKKVKIYMMMFLVLSLVFISPMSLRVYAGDPDPVPDPDATTVRDCNKQFVNYNFDLKDSFIVSVLTMCLPGILNKLSEYRNIQRDAAICYYDAVSMGRDPSYCEVMKSYDECVMGVNEVMVLTVIGDAIDFVRDLFNQILSDPLFFGYKFAERKMRAAQEANCKTSGGQNNMCKVSSFMLLPIDLTAIYNTLTNIDKIWEELMPKENTDVEKFNNIKEEVEELKKSLPSSDGGSSSSSSSSEPEITDEQFEEASN